MPEGRKCLTDRGLEVVPGGGIEPSPHGSSGLQYLCDSLIWQENRRPSRIRSWTKLAGGGIGWIAAGTARDTA